MPHPAKNNGSGHGRWRASPTGRVNFGCLGVGNFARMVLLPAIGKSQVLHPSVICSAKGLSAAHTGRKFGFDAATADEDDVFRDPAVHAVFIVTRHDQHARQTIKALRAGKHVFVEKPLALAIDEIAQIEEALADASQPRPLLMVGFNRRFSPIAVEVKQFFAAVESPLTITVRFNAGDVPADHWTQDETCGGGRIMGEACHAIDLAAFLAGSPPIRVFAESIGGPHSPAITDDQCFIMLRHANGSISSIAYLAGGDKGFAKERVEVLGGGRMVIIDDFRDLITCADGKVRRKRHWRQDKGHRTEIAAFAKALAEGGPSPIGWEDLRAVSLASILAVRSIREGTPLDIP